MTNSTARSDSDLPWAIYSDYSGVANIGTGGFATELEALESLIDLLECERALTADKIASAKRRRRVLLAKARGAA